MAAKEVRAGGAFVEFSLRRKGLERQLRQIGDRLKRFGTQVRQIGAVLSAAGGAISAPFAASLAIFQKYGDTLDKTSRRTGIAVESLSELRFAAEQSGSSLEEFEKGIRGAQRSIFDLGRGLSTQVDAFAELGLTFADLNGLNPEDQFTLIADRVAKIEDPTTRAAVAMATLGRAGQRLVPLLAGGADGIGELREQARRLGLTIGTDAADNAAKLGDTLNILKSQVRAIAFNVGSALSKELQKLVERTQDILKAAIDWVKINGDLVRTVASVGGAILAVGAVFVGLGTAIGIAGFAATSLAAVMSALLSPIGLVVTAIGAAGVALFRFTDIGGQAVAFLRERFGSLLESVSVALNAIADAFKGGDIKLAAQILWNTLKLITLEGAQGVINGAIELKNNILKAITETTIGIIAEGSDLYAGMQTVWQNIVAGAKSAWEKLKNGGTVAFEALKLGAKRLGNEVKGSLDEAFDASAANNQALGEFSKAINESKALKDQQLATIEETRKAEIEKIEAAAKSRKEAIKNSLAIELDAINKRKDAEKAGVKNEIDRLRKQQQRLIDRAEAEKNAALAKLAARDGEDRFALGGNPDLDLGQRAASRAAGVTSSFSIRALGPNNDLARRNLNANEKAVKELGEIKEALSGEFLPLNIT